MSGDTGIIRQCKNPDLCGAGALVGAGYFRGFFLPLAFGLGFRAFSRAARALASEVLTPPRRPRATAAGFLLITNLLVDVAQTARFRRRDLLYLPRDNTAGNPHGGGGRG